MTVTLSLARQIAAMTVPLLPVQRGGCVVAADGNIIEAVGINGAIGNRVALGSAGLMGEIIGFRDGRAILMGLAALSGIAPGALVLPDPGGGTVAV
jgi:flagellum-specific ATP synthase